MHKKELPVRRLTPDEVDRLYTSSSDLSHAASELIRLLKEHGVIFRLFWPVSAGAEYKRNTRRRLKEEGVCVQARSHGPAVKGGLCMPCYGLNHARLQARRAAKKAAS